MSIPWHAVLPESASRQKCPAPRCRDSLADLAALSPGGRVLGVLRPWQLLDLVFMLSYSEL